MELYSSIESEWSGQSLKFCSYITKIRHPYFYPQANTLKTPCKNRSVSVHVGKLHQTCQNIHLLQKLWDIITTNKISSIYPLHFTLMCSRLWGLNTLRSCNIGWDVSPIFSENLGLILLNLLKKIPACVYANWARNFFHPLMSTST